MSRCEILNRDESSSKMAHNMEAIQLSNAQQTDHS